MIAHVRALLRGALLVAAAAGAGGAVLVQVRDTVAHALRRLPAVLEEPGAAPEALATVTVVAAAGALALAWTWLVACLLACVLESLAPLRGTTPRVAPTVLRPRLVRVVVGAVVTPAVVLAVASPAGAQGPGPGVDPATVAGLLLPDRALGSVRATSAAPVASTPAPAPPPSSRRTVRVASGDTLWGMAARLLPARSSDRDVDRAWRALHAANRAELGPDPDLILPGTVLRVPQAAFDSSVPSPGDHR